MSRINRFQAIGKIDVDLNELKIDMATVAGHKVTVISRCQTWVLGHFESLWDGLVPWP